MIGYYFTLSWFLHRFSPTEQTGAERWKKAATLRVPRAFATSVPLSDGRLWILGGLGSKTILQTTEILQEKADGTWKVTQGPNLPNPLFGHCATILPNGNVLIAGGFDGTDQSHMSGEFHWENHVDGKWIKEPWTKMLIQRYDHSCYIHGGSAYALGGSKANIDPLIQPERYNTSFKKWETVPKTWENELPDVLRSFSVGISEGKLALIGGVSCQTGHQVGNGRKCSKRSEVYEFEPLQGWKLSENEILHARSSHVGINIPITIEKKCL